MRAKWPFLAVILGLGLGYVAYPYVTLYRLGVAVRGADAATLHRLVDWPAVREGIKEDICDYVVDDPQDRQASSQLPAFGASFVRGITANAVDQNVTPEALVDAVRPASEKGRGFRPLTTVLFDEHFGKTTVAVIQTFETPADVDANRKLGAEEGWGQSFEKLDAELVRGSAA